MSFRRMQSLGYLTNHLARLFAQELALQIKPLGIVPGQFPALLELYEQDGQTQKALVEKLDVEQATMANTLNRMERDGLVERRDHAADGRAKTIHLTSKSQAIQSEAFAAARAANMKAMSGLSPDEQRQMIGIMQRMIASLKNANS